MKGREAKGSQPADLLVCFPSRAHHLTLMQKPICSPSRPSEPNKKRNHHQHNLKKSSTRYGTHVQSSPSPTLWAKNKQMDSENSEPTSPKVTCAGQIKIRHKKATKPGKNWQSVMEEIERIHSTRKYDFGFKKEAMQFLTCLRNLKLDFRCFGAFPSSDDEEYQETHMVATEISNLEAASTLSGTVFSKWFMVLQENQNSELVAQPSAPPSNALLLMRCRSAPAKQWLKESNKRHEEMKEEHEHGDQGKREMGSVRPLRLLMEEDKREEEMKKKKDNLKVIKLSRSKSWRS